MSPASTIKGGTPWIAAATASLLLLRIKHDGGQQHGGQGQ